MIVLIQNMLMVYFAFISLFIGVWFFAKEKDAGRMRPLLLLLGITCFLANIGYFMMSLGVSGLSSLFYRNIGIIGVDFFVFFGYSFFLSNLNVSVRVRNIVSGSTILLLMAALLFHCMPSDLKFFTDDYGYISFVSNHGIGYYTQAIYSFTCTIGASICSIFWYRQERTTRGRRFVVFIWASMVLLSVSYIPNLLGFKTSHPAFFYCLGVILNFLAAWQIGVRSSAYVITTRSLGEDVFGAVKMGLLVFDIDEKLTLRNEYVKNALKIYEVKGQRATDIFDMTQEEYKAIFDELIMTGKSEFRCYARNSDRKYLLTPVMKYDRYNEPLCVIVSMLDITREEEMINEIVKANKAKGDFLASMSHEIRTPINAVLGMNELILRESKEKETIEYAYNIEKSGRLLLSIINDILDVSKVESGKMSLVLVDYDPASVINDVIIMLSERAKSKGLEFDIDIDENIPSVLYGDEVRVRQIMMNLLTNAIKYTDEGSIGLKVLSEKHGKNAKIVIIVSDTGHGIKSEEMDTIFDSFIRTDEQKNRTIEGSGLGLALTKSFAQMMGGTITVDSEYGKGSTFTVSLVQGIIDETPIGDYNSRIMEERSSLGHFGTMVEATGVRILVVDDVDINSRVVEGLLKDSGAEIDIAGSGREAIERCKTNEYDLIFMDYIMPEMDGIEALGHIRSEGMNVKTPVIILTANALVGAKETYKKAGFEGFLSKPVIPSQLDTVILNTIPDKVSLKETDYKDDIFYDNPSDDEFIKLLSDGIEGIEVRDAIEKYSGTLDFYLEMLKEFIETDRVAKMCSALEKKDYSEYRLNAHTLKGTSRSVGLYELSHIFEMLHKACDNSDYEYVQSHHQTMLEKMSDTTEKIRDIIAKYDFNYQI